jgi:hypothetical protein
VVKPDLAVSLVPLVPLDHQDVLELVVDSALLNFKPSSNLARKVQPLHPQLHPTSPLSTFPRS